MSSERSDASVNSWEARWRDRQTPWDAGEPAPALRALLGETNLTPALPNGRGLVPGCGAGYDVAALASAQRRVVGLDIAPSSADRFEEVMREQGASEHTELVIGDFFEARLGAFDLVYDYTFLCALPLDKRGAWAARMGQLVKPGGQLITLVFPMVDPPADYEGPPWPLHPEDVSGLLETRFDLLDDRDVKQSHPGREGKERLLRWRRR